MNNIKVAIVHDWLTGMRGGEKCLEVFCELFPEATLFTLVHNKGSVSPGIEGMDIRTSFLQKIPGISKNYRNFLPFFPAAIESFDTSGYDLILSSSHCAAKGARKAQGALHISYCYTPMRYAWTFFEEYFGDAQPLKKWFIEKVINRLKKWDLATNKRIDYFVAISHNVKNRIWECYGRDSDVIYPPVDIDSHAADEGDKGYYLVVSALVPYKRVDLAVKAFNSNNKNLVVIGKGPDLKGLKAAAGKNIEFLEWARDEDLDRYYSGCRAVIFPTLEDFGIVPLEAQAHGKPVIAYAAGGALETIVPMGEENPTGIFFREQTSEALNVAVETFENNRDIFIPENIRENARRFNRARFKDEIRNYIENKWKVHIDENA